MVTSYTCRNCGSDRVHRSRRRNGLERVLTSFGCGMQRCHECNRRYLSLGRIMVPTQKLERFARKTGLALAMAAAAVVLLAVVLWFSRTQSAPVSDTDNFAPSGQERMEHRSGV